MSRYAYFPRAHDRLVVHSVMLNSVDRGFDGPKLGFRTWRARARVVLLTYFYAPASLPTSSQTGA